MKKRLEITTKTDLNEFNMEEARGWTIGRFQQIEYRINAIIVEYFNPEDKRKFEKIMLNSSVLDIGSKMKILANTGKVEKKIIEKIRTLASIRNGFAHAPITDNFNIPIEKNEQGQHRAVAVVAESIIEVMTSQGVIKTRNAMDYLREFLQLNKEIREAFDK